MQGDQGMLSGVCLGGSVGEAKFCPVVFGPSKSASVIDSSINYDPRIEAGEWNIGGIFCGSRKGPVTAVGTDFVGWIFGGGQRLFLPLLPSTVLHLFVGERSRVTNDVGYVRRRSLAAISHFDDDPKVVEIINIRFREKFQPGPTRR